MSKDKPQQPLDSHFRNANLPEHGRSGAHTEQWYEEKVYRVVRGYSMGHFESNVNKLIGLGWQPFGTLQVIPLSATDGYAQLSMMYFREMTRTPQQKRT